MIFLKALLAIFYTVIFSWVILKNKNFRLEGISNKTVLGGYYLKLIFGFLFWAIYTYHSNYQETSDALLYFQDAKIINGAFWQNPVHFFKLIFSVDLNNPELAPYFQQMVRWERAVGYGVPNDNPTIIKFNAIAMFFSLGYYHTHTIFMNFISYSGLILIFKFFEHFSKGISPTLLFGAILLPPSLLFWGAGVMKEGILIFGIGILLFGFIKLDDKHFIKAFGLVLVSVWLLVFTKAYVLVAMAPALIFLIFSLRKNTNHLILKFIAVHALLAIFVFTLGLWVDDYNVLHMFQSKMKDFYNLGNDQNVGSMISVPVIKNHFDLILNAPNALFNAYFRPHLLEANSFMYLAAAIENLAYLILIIWAFIKFNKLSTFNLRLLLFCLSVVLGLGLLMGLITPILGALVRYKIPALPFFVVFCFLLMSNHLASLPSPLNWIKRFMKS